MNNSGKYTAHDKMSDLICGRSELLQVLSRFNMPLGFGDATVEEVCNMNNVHCPTFLAVINFIASDNIMTVDNPEEVSVRQLTDYLKSAHSYFLDLQLPDIRLKLIQALDFAPGNDVPLLILKFFDAYVLEVRRHMDFENINVFTYVEDLLTTHTLGEFRIDKYARKHDHFDQKLTELKNIIIKYNPSNADNYLLNRALFDIFTCEKDFVSHCEVEDYLFVPVVRKLEEECK